MKPSSFIQKQIQFKSVPLFKNIQKYSVRTSSKSVRESCVRERGTTTSSKSLRESCVRERGATISRSVRSLEHSRGPVTRKGSG
jgi:hypothetical protein